MVLEFVPRAKVPDRCSTCPCHVPAICDQLSGAWCPTRRALCAGPGPSDDELVAAHRAEAAEGRAGASFGRLFERHHRHVVAWGCRFSGSYEFGLDLAQEVFIRAYTRLGAFRGDSRFTTWLYTITRNCFRDHLKARAARPTEVAGFDLTAVGGAVRNAAEGALETLAARRLVRRLLRDARLEPTELRAFVLHYRDGMPLEAITARLGLTNTSGAKAPIVSARRKLHAAAERWRSGADAPRIVRTPVAVLGRTA